MRELLIGCGSNRERRVREKGVTDWGDLVTLDFNADHKPDIVWDLTNLPLPFGDDEFDSISAFDVLEHTGQQGDWKFFFNQWSDFWRILKHDGRFYGISPHPTSPWAWADPSHTRVLSPESFVFLNQPAYVDQVGVTAMSDFRHIYKADFDPVYFNVGEDKSFTYVLKAVKPSRYDPVRIEV